MSYNIEVDIRTESSSLRQANQEMRNLRQSSQQVGQQAQRTGSTSSRSFTAIRLAAAGAATAVTAIAGAIAAVNNAVRQELTIINRLNDLALVTGDSEIALAALEARAISVGVSMETVSGVIQRQQSQIQNGSAIFQQLGLDLDRLANLTPTRAFQEIANSIKETDDTALRARGLQELFGRANVDALKLAGTTSQIRQQLTDAGGLIATATERDAARELDNITNAISAASATIRRRMTQAFGPSVVAGARFIERVLSRGAGANTENIIAAQREILDDLINNINNLEISSPEDLERVQAIRDSFEQTFRIAVDREKLEQRINALEGRRDINSLETKERLQIQLSGLATIEQLEESRVNLLEQLEQKYDAIIDRQAESVRNARELAREEERAAENAARIRQSAITSLSALGSSRTDLFDISAITRSIEEVRTLAESQSLSLFSGNTDMSSQSESLRRWFTVVSDNYGELAKAMDEALQKNQIMAESQRFFATEAGKSVTNTRQLVELLGEAGINIGDLATASEQLFGGDQFGLLGLSELPAEEALARILTAMQGITRESERQKNFNREGAEAFRELSEIYSGNLDIVTQISAIESGKIRSQEELNRYIEEEVALKTLTARLTQLGVADPERQARAYINENRELRNRRDLLLREREILDRFVDSTLRSAGDILGNSIVDGLQTGRFAFRDFINDIGNMLIRSGIRELVASIFSPQQDGRSVAFNIISSIFGGMVGGGSGGTSMYGTAPPGTVGIAPWRAAKGTVVNRPTSVMGGQGLIGEAGPEAILPLRRGPNGNLGVEAHGGGSSTVNINTTVNVQGGSSNSQQIADRTSKAVERAIEAKVYEVLRRESRSGNALNRPISAF